MEINFILLLFGNLFLGLLDFLFIFLDVIFKLDNNRPLLSLPLYYCSNLAITHRLKLLEWIHLFVSLLNHHLNFLYSKNKKV